MASRLKKISLLLFSFFYRNGKLGNGQDRKARNPVTKKANINLLKKMARAKRAKSYLESLTGGEVQNKKSIQNAGKKQLPLE